MKTVFVMALIYLAECLQAQVTGNVVNRVVQVRYRGASGTAFVMDYADRQFFVTAEHMVDNAGANAAIEVLSQNDSQWHTISFSVLHGSRPCADVAVLIPPDKKRFLPAEPIPYPYNFAIGQEAYFLG